jgi:hypothetical protein
MTADYVPEKTNIHPVGPRLDNILAATIVRRVRRYRPMTIATILMMPAAAAIQLSSPVVIFLKEWSQLAEKVESGLTLASAILLESYSPLGCK